MIKDLELIKSKNFPDPYCFSFDFKATFSYDLLCSLVDVLMDAIQQNELADRVLITEDGSGNFYSFFEFAQLWNNDRGFFMRL